jgi:thiosulfate reductase cytochrome b subunit
MAAMLLVDEPEKTVTGHSRSVRLLHWILAASVLTLTLSGFLILMVHPRLYWGETGNDLTPALFELPISRNYHHGGWSPATRFFADQGAIVSAARTYDIFNQNSWGRSLHFLAAWVLVLTGTTYVVVGLVSGHLWRHLIPRSHELKPSSLYRDIVAHLLLRMPPTAGGPPYGVLQKLSYAGVVFIALPLMILTGLTMSPRVAAAFPVLLDLFGGSQSARTIHFCVFATLFAFMVVHVTMVAMSGFGRQIRAMTFGS